MCSSALGTPDRLKEYILVEKNLDLWKQLEAAVTGSTLTAYLDTNKPDTLHHMVFLWGVVTVQSVSFNGMSAICPGQALPTT